MTSERRPPGAGWCWIAAVLVLGACAGAPTSPPPTVVLSAEPPASPVSAAPPAPPTPAPSPARVAPAPDPARLVEIDPSSAEASRVLRATFPKYLRGPCPPNPAVARAGTWSELDRLQAEAHARGHFRPRVLQRLDGSFSHPDADETLYAIDLGECVGNGWVGCLDVVFTRGRSAPAFRVEHGGWGRACGYDGVAGRDGIDAVMRKQPAGEEWSRLTPGTGSAATWSARE